MSFEKFENRKRKIIKIFRKIIALLNKDEFEKVYIYGSWVWGYPHENSDIDIILLESAPLSLREKILKQGVKINKCLEIIEKKMANYLQNIF